MESKGVTVTTCAKAFENLTSVAEIDAINQISFDEMKS
jgi:hypothetical protein